MDEMKSDKVDSKMLEYLDVLINMDVLENEENWDEIEALEEESGDIETSGEDCDEA